MSYEAAMLKQLAMPTRDEVAQALLRALLRHGGVIKEFGSHQQIVDELADECELNAAQRGAFLETIYRKQNRRKRAYLWHRLLFRAADSLAHENLIMRPTRTVGLTGRREWMLTESGFDRALRLANMPADKKENLPVKSFEVQKVVKKLLVASAPKNYDPIDSKKKIITVTRESAIRLRGFRLAVIEAYNYKCAVCGLKLKSPDSISWEIQAAHIVPNGFLGRDDVWNGIAMCRLHHWSFDVGWFTVGDDYRVEVSPVATRLPDGFAKLGAYDVLEHLTLARKISLPQQHQLVPHRRAIAWHRQNVFYDSRTSL